MGNSQLAECIYVRVENACGMQWFIQKDPGPASDESKHHIQYNLLYKSKLLF